jgi:hypothetical protein
MAQQASELSAVRREMRNDTASTERQVASLKNGEERNRKEADAIAGKLAVRRIDFEATKNHNQELAPGVSLMLTGTDVMYRRELVITSVTNDSATGYLLLLKAANTTEVAAIQQSR